MSSSTQKVTKMSLALQVPRSSGTMEGIHQSNVDILVLVFVEVISTMPGKNVQWKQCSKFMRSDNLKRHAGSCHSQVDSTPPFNASSFERRVSTGNNKRAVPS